MRKTLAIFTCMLGASGMAHAANVTVAIDAGILKNATGSANLQAGSLLELIASPVSVASPDGVFTPPTASNSVTGNDILVASFAMNNGFGAGETQNSVTINMSTVPAGYALLLRWFSGTNYAGGMNPTSPTAPSLAVGTTYGEYRSDTQESDEAGLTWFVPNTPGYTYTGTTGLDFQTIAAGGSNLDQIGYAGFTPLPEPSTYMMALGMATLGGLVYHRRHRRS